MSDDSSIGDSSIGDGTPYVGVCRFGMKPGGVIFGNWPGGRGGAGHSGSQPDLHSKTPPQNIAARPQSTNQLIPEILSIRPRIDKDGNQIKPADKKRFRTSQESKVDRRIEGGVSPMTNMSALRTSLARPTSLRRTASGLSTTSPLSRRTSIGYPIQLTRCASSGFTATLQLKRTPSERSSVSANEKKLDDEDIKVKSAFDDSETYAKEVKDCSGSCDI